MAAYPKKNDEIKMLSTTDAPEPKIEQGDIKVNIYLGSSSSFLKFEHLKRSD